MKTSIALFAVFGLFLLSNAHPAAKLPAGHEPKDAALDNYVRLVINNFFKALNTGIPALGIPSLDPMNIGNITIPTLQVVGGHVDAATAFTAVHSLSFLTVTSLHIDLQKLSLDLRSFLTDFKIDGLYDLEGIALAVLPVYGNGNFTVDAIDLPMLGGGSLALVGDYIQLTSLKMDCNFTSLLVHFDNLLGGGDLGDTLNDIVTALGGEIFYMVKPPVIDALSSGIMKVVNDALSRYPIGNLTQLDIDIQHPI